MPSVITHFFGLFLLYALKCHTTSQGQSRSLSSGLLIQNKIHYMAIIYIVIKHWLTPIYWTQHIPQTVQKIVTQTSLHTKHTKHNRNCLNPVRQFGLIKYVESNRYLPNIYKLKSNMKLTLLKTNGAIRLNKICRAKQVCQIYTN